MTYQRANYIKSASLSNLIEQNIRSGEGFLKSTGGAIGSKLKAKVTGIKEKFDPLNFFKFLSRGNPLAFRLLGGRAFGRLTGRSEDDVDYFAGGPGSRAGGRTTYKKNKKSAEPLNTSIASGKKITPIMAGDNVADEITKLYTLLKQSYEDKIKKSELQKDFEEGKKDKEEKRHKELIKALMSVGGGGGKPTATKTDDKPWYMVILDVLKDAWGKIGAFAESVGKIVNGIITKVKGVVANIWNKITGIAGEVFEKVMGVIRKIGSTLGELLSKIPGMSWIGEKISTGFKAITEGAKDVFKMGAKTEAKAAEKVAEKTVGKTILKGIPILGIGAGLFFGAERALAGDWVGAGLEVAGGVAGTIPGVGTAAEVGLGAAAAIHESNFDSKKENAPTATPLPPTGSGGGRGGMGGPTSEEMDTAKTTIPTAAPETSITSSGPQMVAVTKENLDNQIDAQADGGNQSITVNKTNNSSIGGKSESGSVGETSVRNDEDSLMRVMKGTLRMV